MLYFKIHIQNRSTFWCHYNPESKLPAINMTHYLTHPHVGSSNYQYIKTLL